MTIENFQSLNILYFMKHENVSREKRFIYKWFCKLSRHGHICRSYLAWRLAANQQWFYPSTITNNLYWFRSLYWLKMKNHSTSSCPSTFINSHATFVFYSLIPWFSDSLIPWFPDYWFLIPCNSQVRFLSQYFLLRLLRSQNSAPDPEPFKSETGKTELSVSGSVGC